MCVEGKLCLSKRVPTPAPGATKEAFFAHQWLPLTLGPLPLEGMSGFPRWHTETAIRGRKPGAGASWESCQGRGEGGGGDKEVHEVAFCVLNSKCTDTNSQKDTFFFHTHKVMHARVQPLQADTKIPLNYMVHWLNRKNTHVRTHLHIKPVACCVFVVINVLNIYTLYTFLHNCPN